VTSLSVQDALLPQRTEQAPLPAAKMRPESTLDAPGPGSKTWSKPSSRPRHSCRARNPSETIVAAAQASVCGDDAQRWGSNHPRSSPYCEPAKQRRPAAQTRAPPPASRTMLRPFEHALVVSYSRGSEITTMIPQIDGCDTLWVAKRCKSEYQCDCIAGLRFPGRTRLPLPS